MSPENAGPPSIAMSPTESEADRAREEREHEPVHEPGDEARVLLVVEVADTRTRRPSRSRRLNARSMWRGSRRSIGTVRMISSRTACCIEPGVICARTHCDGECLGAVDHGVARARSP